MQMLERSYLFLRKAGTIILGLSIILWCLSTYPKAPETATSAEAVAQSFSGLANGLAFYIENCHLLGGRCGNKALQRGGDTQQVAALQRGANALGDLVRQCCAIFFLLLQLHMPIGDRAQCYQGKADEQAQPCRD